MDMQYKLKMCVVDFGWAILCELCLNATHLKKRHIQIFMHRYIFSQYVGLFVFVWCSFGGHWHVKKQLVLRYTMIWLQL